MLEITDLHADVAGSTSLVQLNEGLAHDRIQDAFRRFSETIASHGGTAHEIRGDALVAEFARASDAVAASLWTAVLIEGGLMVATAEDKESAIQEAGEVIDHLLNGLATGH